MKRKGILILWSFSILLFFLSGCATMERAKKPYEVTSRGTLIYGGEYEFTLLPQGWNLFWPEGESSGEFAFGFMKRDPGPFPSQSVFAYDEEPFGYSTTFENRQKEFFKRFLWNAVLKFEILEKKKVEFLGREGLSVMVEGKDPVKKEKAKSKVIFTKRGERVVAFYITQWRPMDGTYDPSAFEVFDRFVQSFKYLKKSFFETL
ncbi:MAG: hypothetical protein QME90_07885 [Thermodesulfobacteriota bacterium]|nr:hypothetical protein [Thermodesulfobacteriota bacterium]